MYEDSMITDTRKKNNDPKALVIPCLTKELVISVCKMKVTELNKWTPVLQSEETLKLCFEGHVSRINGQKRRYVAYKTQPLTARLSNYLFRQVNGELCSLVGELYDPSNNLPRPVKSKFKDGIPKKWKSIIEVWDGIQKHSFCRRQLRKFSSRIEWLESLKTSGVLRVSSRGRIIIPSPKYLKVKNVEQREAERLQSINSHLELIRTNLELAPVHITDNVGGTPRKPVENNCNTVNGTKSRQCTTCENHTESSLHKKNVRHKISAHSRCFNMQHQKNSGNHVNDTHRSSLNQKKLLTCKRKLIIDKVQNKISMSNKISKNTYEKMTKNNCYRCLPHRRRYLLRSTPAASLLQNNNNNKYKKEQRATSITIRDIDRIAIPQRKQPLRAKRKLNVFNNKTNLLQCQGERTTPSLRNQNREGSKETGSSNENAVKNGVLEAEDYSETCRNKSAVNVGRNKGREALLKLPYKQSCLLDKDIKSDNFIRNGANDVRRSMRRVSSQDRSDVDRPKKKSENFPPQKANRRDVEPPQSTYEASGPALTDRKSNRHVKPSPKRHEKRNFESIPGEDQDLSDKKVTPRNIPEDMSRKEKFIENSTTPALNTRKCRQSRLVSSERQRESRRSVVTRQPNEKELHKVPVKSREKKLSSNKSHIDVTSDTKITAETVVDTKEAATTLEKAASSAPKRKISKKDSKQPRISDPQPSGKTESSIPSKDTLETPPKKFEKPEPQLSLGDIEDIMNTGAPRTLKQRKKLRKTIDSYAKSQNTCSDLFSDPDYNHLIGDDTCSSQQWDTDYAEAVEELVSGKFSDQISLGSTSPAPYLQDFFSDDNQSVRSTSPFERIPCDEEFKVRYVHRVLKEKNEHSRRKSLNVDFMSSFAQNEMDASTEADATYNALIQGKPVSQKLFDLKCKKKHTSSDDSSSECSDEL